MLKKISGGKIFLKLWQQTVYIPVNFFSGEAGELKRTNKICEKLV
jgi:hypothetical protein